ncbi:MAG: hypothetical protein LBN38_00550 [Verrucomicrobiota bacterium]|jgi:hypothetical protein|nr:hypothetical protein [Verrucomicrobiota bacterium]
MITKLYWFFRLAAYLTCMGGIFYHLAHTADAAPPPWGLYAVGVGFVFFFISYALRAYLRFGPRKNTQREEPPAV